MLLVVLEGREKGKGEFLGKVMIPCHLVLNSISVHQVTPFLGLVLVVALVQEVPLVKEF
jgi:hypothetical protein